MASEPQGSTGGSLDDLLRKREQLDRNIEEQFRRDMAVMFVDLQGSTTLYDQQGDIDGRIFVRRLEDLAQPAIAEGEGRLVKRLGDGLLAAFPSAAGAARCANGLQRAVAQYNLKAGAAEKFHIRVGLHWGKVLFEESGDVYGDVVNVAARLESQAEPSQTTVSAEIFRELERADVFCLPLGKVQLKGKKEAMELYLLPWNPRQRHMPMRAVARQQTAVLRALRRESNLIVLFSPSREEVPLENCHRHEIPFPESAISDCCRRSGEFLERVNKKGSQREGLLAELRSIGEELFRTVLPEAIRNEIKKARATHLLFQLEDTLAHVPWEFMHDGEAFLSLRFACGRAIESQGKMLTPPARRFEPPYRMLLVANPTGDLPAAVEEAQLIQNAVTQFPNLRLDTLADRVSREAFLAGIPQASILHFSGHTEYERGNPLGSRWLFADGAVRSEEILQFSVARASSPCVMSMGKMPMPLSGRALPQIVFVNSCESGRASLLTDHGLFGLAHAFLARGVQHYIGTLWNVYDQPSRDFAHVFYSRLLEGYSVGNAVRAARFEVVDKFGAKSLMWASYILYGDPAATPFPMREHEAVGAVSQPAAQKFPAQAVAAVSPVPIAPAAPAVTPAVVAPAVVHVTVGTGTARGILRFFIGLAAVVVVALLAVVVYIALKKTPEDKLPRKVAGHESGTLSEPTTGSTDKTTRVTPGGTTAVTPDNAAPRSRRGGNTQNPEGSSTPPTPLEVALPKNPLIAILPYQGLVHLHEQFGEYQAAIDVLKKFIMDFPHLTSEIQGAADQIRNLQKELDDRKEKDKEKENK